MKILYGYDNDHYIDITLTVFNRCLKDDGIKIPAGDTYRCNIIGFDPYPNIIKHIKVIDDNNESYIYTAIKEVNIKFDSISKQLKNAVSPKTWWNSVGKYIEDPAERLKTLHKQINLQFISWGGGFELEYPEQLMAMRYLNENSKVLEIGGNIGRVSHVIQTILNNPRNHVIMECDKEMAKKLRTNLDLNTYTEVPIETNALSKTKLYFVNNDGPRPLKHFKEPEKAVECPTISYSEICQKYNVDFNVLVADCEGSLFYIFKEDPDMLNNLDTVIMENDYTDLDHKRMVDSILTMKGFKCVYQEKGVPWASWSCCYEYFYEVWQK